MQRAPTALTADLHTYRPQGTGWVAYYDISQLPGPPGLAMAWRVPGEGLRWVAVLAKMKDGYITAAGKLGEWEHLYDVVSSALRGERSNRLLTEGQALALLFPHVSNHPTVLASNGLPDLAEHAGMSRRALAEADLPPAMRAAFEACLDHGAPRDVPFTRLREKTFNAHWPALALAARHPELVRSVIAAEPALLAADDPMAALRHKWPGMTDAHLRRLREEGRATGTGLLSNSSVRQASLELLFAIPIDWWPTPECRTHFEACATAIGAIAGSCGPGQTRAALAAASKGDWPAFAARLQRAAGLAAGPGKGNALADRGRDCRDPVQALFRDVMVPLLASREDEGGVIRMEYAYGEVNARAKLGEVDPTLIAAGVAALDLLYGDKSAPAILETSRIWHERQAVMQADIRGGDGETEWPALFEDEHRHGDLGVVAIRTYAGLREEGADLPDGAGVHGLDHCVASRLPECITGQAHVLSVRRHASDGTWQRLSTCQVAVYVAEGGKPHLSITEHRGKGNTEPPGEAVEAISELSKTLLAGAVPVDPVAVSRRTPARRGSIGRKCGYDWQDPVEMALAVRTWEPFLPRWARGLGPDGLYDALVERGMIPAPESPPALALG